MTSDSQLIFRRRVKVTQSGVIAEALAEKLGKLRLQERMIEREQQAQRAAAEELVTRMSEVLGQIEELQAALRDHQIVGPVVDESERRLLVDRTERNRWAHEHNNVTLEIHPETRAQKQIALAEAKEILSSFGSIHVRELYSLLATKGVEISSPQRLSQILSESQEFEADRTKGWSLKR